MNCAAFERWLDDGRPAPEAMLMKAHAFACSRCAEELRAALELDEMLSVVAAPSVAPEFNDSVMRRIHRHAAVSGWRRTISLTVEILAEPLVPLSLASAMVAFLHSHVLAAAVLRITASANVAIDHLVRSDMGSGFSAAVAIAGLAMSWRFFRILSDVIWER